MNSQVLSILFYISLIIPILIELNRLIYSKKYYQLYLNTKDFDSPDFVVTKEVGTYITLDTIYFIICIIGAIFTSPNFLFMPFMLLGLFRKSNIAWYRTDSIFCICWMTFIILNKFHLHWLI